MKQREDFFYIFAYLEIVPDLGVESRLEVPGARGQDAVLGLLLGAGFQKLLGHDELFKIRTTKFFRHNDATF